MKKLILLLAFATSTLFGDITILCSSKDGKIKQSHKADLARIQQIADDNGITIKIKPTPWKRALSLVKKGKADGVIGASYKTSRAKFAVYPMKDGVVDDSRRQNPGKTYYIYKNINSTIHWDGKKFTGVDGAVGAVTGFAVIEDLKKHSNVKTLVKSSRVALLRDVSKNKLAAFAGLEKDAAVILNKYPKIASLVVKEKMPIRKKNYFSIFSKKTYKRKKVEMEKIWDGLK